MLTNDQMKSNRYGRWAAARKKYRFIVLHLEAGRTVQIVTATSYTNLTRKHIDTVSCDRTSVYIQRGKDRDCIDYCGIRVFAS